LAGPLIGHATYAATMSPQASARGAEEPHSYLAPANAMPSASNSPLNIANSVILPVSLKLTIRQMNLAPSPILPPFGFRLKTEPRPLEIAVTPWGAS
jgi:hypothetical protein